MHVEKTICPQTGKILGYKVIRDDLKEIPIVTEFLKFMSSRSGSINTNKAYAYDFLYYFDFLKKEEISFFDAPFIPRVGINFFNYLSNQPQRKNTSKKLSPGSIIRIQAAVESIYTYLDDNVGMFHRISRAKPYISNPNEYKSMTSFARKKNTITSRYAKPDTPKRLPRPLKEDIVKEMLDAFISDRDKAIFLLALEGGLRIGEILTLRFEDIEQSKEQICIRVRENSNNLFNKTKTERIVPIKSRKLFWKYYNQYILGPRPESKSDYVFISHKGETKGEPLSYSGFRSIFEYWRKKLGIDDPSVTFHAARHYYATTALEHGMSPETLREIMGHSSLSSTLLYTQVTQSKIRREYDAVADSQDNCL